MSLKIRRNMFSNILHFIQRKYTYSILLSIFFPFRLPVYLYCTIIYNLPSIEKDSNIWARIINFEPNKDSRDYLLFFCPSPPLSASTQVKLAPIKSPIKIAQPEAIASEQVNRPTAIWVSGTMR